VPPRDCRIARSDISLPVPLLYRPNHTIHGVFAALSAVKPDAANREGQWAKRKVL
jgi:hypothetical protein